MGNRAKCKKIVTLPETDIRKKRTDLGWDKSFLNRTRKEKSQKKRMDQSNFSKIKRLYLSKDTIKALKKIKPNHTLEETIYKIFI